jgi:hypothetical protein
MGIGDMLQAERDADDARRYRFLRDRGYLDGHVMAYESAHDLDESEGGSDEYSANCDAAVDEMRAAAQPGAVGE